MPSSVRRQAVNLTRSRQSPLAVSHALLACSLLSGLVLSVPAQNSQTVHVEFNMFSGRPRPKAEIADAGKAQAILDSLAVRIVESVPCSEVPAMLSSPGYTAALLQFAVPVAQRKTLVVRNGYIHYDSALPCYRDPGSNLEKLAVATAFQYPDLTAPGGPKPMEYLACMVPDSLHAESSPCATALPRSGRQGSLPAVGVAGPAPTFGVDGRFRSQDAPQLLLERPEPPSR